MKPVHEHWHGPIVFKVMLYTSCVRDLPRGIKLDIYHLIALLISYTYCKVQDGSSRRLDFASVNLKNDINDKLKTNLDTFAILDALAGISVSKEGSQVVAVVLQSNSEEPKIDLTITQNNRVNPNLIPHLKSIWGKLQALSLMNGAGRGGESSQDTT